MPKDQPIFVIHNTDPSGHDSTEVPVPVHCEDCGGFYWTDEKNLALVKQKKMLIKCASCFMKFAAKSGDEIRMGGRIRHGAIHKL